jgi:hypothetical protein
MRNQSTHQNRGQQSWREIEVRRSEEAYGRPPGWLRVMLSPRMFTGTPSRRRAHRRHAVHCFRRQPAVESPQNRTAPAPRMRSSGILFGRRTLTPQNQPSVPNRLTHRRFIFIGEHLHPENHAPAVLK